MDYDALKAELTAGHPDTGAYDADDETAAAQLNAINRQINKVSITGDSAFNVTVPSEYAALSDHDQIQWLTFCGRDTIDPFGAANVALVQDIFGGGSTTLSNLAAFRKQAVSRAVELGFGRVRVGDVQFARNLP